MKFMSIFVLIFGFSDVDSIFNGTTTERHQYPYIVMTTSPKFFCVGALISQQHIVTAAHCLMSILPGGSVKVAIAAYEFYGSSRTDGETVRSKVFWIHEKFEMPSAVNDIGLIELPKILTMSKKVNFIGIETKIYPDFDPLEKEVIIAGWGWIDDNQPARKLLHTRMKLLSMNSCLKHSQNYVESLTYNHICATRIVGMPCNGDSGAPFVSVKTGKIVGIMSYVKDAENGVDLEFNDCRSNVPAVATRIASYLTWISKKSGLIFT